MSAFISLRHNNQELVIQRTGAGIAQYFIKDGDKKHHIVYGFDDAKDKESCMGDNLFPFPGRVENEKYVWKGKEYKVTDAAMVSNGNALHGYVTTAEWEYEQKSDNELIATVTVDEEIYAKKGYPFSLKLQLIYTLSDKGLEVQAHVKNIGKEGAPFGLGYVYIRIDLTNSGSILILPSMNNK